MITQAEEKIKNKKIALKISDLKKLKLKNQFNYILLHYSICET